MARAIDPSSILGSWLHSHEEDTDTTTVYRRADYEFPPSRGRKGFELRADGALSEKGIGPTDRSVHTAGRWHLSEDGCLEFFAGTRGSPTRVLPIESADGDKIVVRKGSQTCTLSHGGSGAPER
ncbi:MAG: hypothetical protein HYS12_22125 [Planctomycetes bacterium]|nr:hypothetical protein [Planctomycetota bacterium]